MGKVDITADKKQAGFTLVELAVVMIIIGLLIGGVLKGQELIANAQIASTVAQVKGIDAATSTFQDTYSSMPGDMLRAQNRLPNCTGAGGCLNGNGDSRLDGTANVAAPAGERLQYWYHMNLADLVSGVTNPANLAFGEALPSANVGGGFTVGFEQTGAVAGLAGPNGRGGHYLVLRASPNAVAGAANGAMTASKAARIDRKMDDGAPNSGTVLAIGGVGANNCASAATAAGVYNENTDTLSCSLAIRIQQ